MKLKKLMKKIHEKCSRAKYATVFFTLAFPVQCFAYDGDALLNIGLNVASYLSGAVAGGFATLAVIYAGYELYFGQMTKARFAVILASVGLIFGGSYLAKEFFKNMVS